MERLQSYFNSNVVNVEEIQEIIRVVGAEFEILGKEREKVLNNMFLETLDEYGCTRYEEMFNITPRTDDTLEDRRFTIQTLYKGDTPYTLTALKRKLESLCGEGNVEIIVDTNNYTIDILLGLAAKNQFEIALNSVKKMIPCNMVLTYELKYNQHSLLSQFTHRQLSTFTHYQLRNEYLEISESNTSAVVGEAVVGYAIVGGSE